MRFSQFYQVFLLLVIVTIISARASPLSEREEVENYQFDGDAEDDVTPGFFSNIFSEGEDTYEKRGLTHHKKCKFDFQCKSTHYCSTKRHACYKKLNYLHSCTRSAACKTGYCGVKSHRCAKKKGNGRKCFKSDAACESGYCSPFTNVCAHKGQVGAPCKSPSGCKSGVCSSGKCAAHQRNHPGGPQHSGTP